MRYKRYLLGSIYSFIEEIHLNIVWMLSIAYICRLFVRYWSYFNNDLFNNSKFSAIRVCYDLRAMHQNKRTRVQLSRFSREIRQMPRHNLLGYRFQSGTLFCRTCYVFTSAAIGSRLRGISSFVSCREFFSNRR